MAGSDEERGPRRGASLAGRLRASLDQRLAARRDARLAEQERRARGQAARAELLADLADFGRALGHAQVHAGADRLEIRLGARSLRFLARGEDGEVEVEGDGLSPGWKLRFHDEARSWGLHPPHGAVRPLFDAGLEELVGRAFQLRPVEEAADPAAGDERSPSVPPTRPRTL